MKNSGAVHGETSVYAKRKDGNGRGVERDRRQEQRGERLQQSADAAASDPRCDRREEHVEAFRDERGAEGRDHQSRRTPTM